MTAIAPTYTHAMCMLSTQHLPAAFSPCRAGTDTAPRDALLSRREWYRFARELCLYSEAEAKGRLTNNDSSDGRDGGSGGGHKEGGAEGGVKGGADAATAAGQFLRPLGEHSPSAPMGEEVDVLEYGEGVVPIHPRDFWTRQVEAHRPALMRGAGTLSSAFRLWKPDYLRQAHGDVELKVRQGGETAFVPRADAAVAAVFCSSLAARAEGGHSGYWWNRWNPLRKDVATRCITTVRGLPGPIHLSRCLSVLAESVGAATGVLVCTSAERIWQYFTVEMTESPPCYFFPGPLICTCARDYRTLRPVLRTWYEMCAIDRVAAELFQKVQSFSDLGKGRIRMSELLEMGERSGWNGSEGAAYAVSNLPTAMAWCASCLLLSLLLFDVYLRVFSGVTRRCQRSARDQLRAPRRC